MLQACVDFGIERIVQTSTSEVYGTAKYVPMDEKHPLNPQSPYAASKIGSDKLAESYHRTYGLPVVVLRPFNTYGPRQSPRAVVPAIILQALASQTIRLGSLDPRRDLTFVTDTAAGFTAASNQPNIEGDTIQIGSQQEYSIAELVQKVGTIINKQLKVIHDPARRRPGSSEVERLLASNESAKQKLHWQPKVSLDEGLEQTVAWFRERPDQYRTDLYHV